MTAGIAQEASSLREFASEHEIYEVSHISGIM
jgi:hypothetical protein